MIDIEIKQNEQRKNKTSNSNRIDQKKEIHSSIEHVYVGKYS